MGRLAPERHCPPPMSDAAARSGCVVDTRNDSLLPSLVGVELGILYSTHVQPVDDERAT